MRPHMAAHRARVRSHAVGERAPTCRHGCATSRWSSTLHGMHYTGFIFNDYAKQARDPALDGDADPAGRACSFSCRLGRPVLLGLSELQVPDAHGRRSGLQARSSTGAEHGLQDHADVRHQRGQPEAARAGRRSPTRITHKIDGDAYDLNWVDWNNDRHQDGWLGYMNLGADAWRNHLEGRIAEMIERYGVDAYFLDIVGGHVNSTNGDMHDGTQKLVTNLHDEISRTCSAWARCRTTRCTVSSRCTTPAADPMAEVLHVLFST